MRRLTVATGLVCVLLTIGGLAVWLVACTGQGPRMADTARPKDQYAVTSTHNEAETAAARRREGSRVESAQAEQPASPEPAQRQEPAGAPEQHGLHEVVGSNPSSQGPLNNVFSDKAGVDTKIGAAMSGDGAELVVGRGHGGMGLRSVGSHGGGGVGFGRIHGMGRIDTGGRLGGRASLRLGRGRGMGPVPDWNREAYEAIDAPGFSAVADAPLSTFSIDVDTASYSNVRRFLSHGQMPPVGSVRIEELLNYFDYAYPSPQGQEPLAMHTEVSTAPWNPAHRLAHVGLQARRMDLDNAPASNLVFLIDVSGSMGPQNKLPLLKVAFRMLVEHLGPSDRVAIVVYAGAAGLVLPSTPSTEHETILDSIDRLNAGGSTAGGAGIELAYRIASDHFIRRGNNRVILATDGDFNVGVSSDAALVDLIENKRESGVFLTTLGVGTGNYQDTKLQKLAQHGNGNHAYLDSVHEARKVLVRELGGTLHTVARDVKIQIEFNPARVEAYRLIGYETRRLQARDFKDDRKDAGEVGAGHTVTALYELVPAGAGEIPPAVDPLHYQGSRSSHSDRHANELMRVKLRYKPLKKQRSVARSFPVVGDGLPLAKTSDAFRFAAAVAELGMLLRADDERSDASWAQVIELASGAIGDDPHGDRAGFVRLAEQARAATSVR